MDEQRMTIAFEALGSLPRLRICAAVARAGADGILAGEIAERLGRDPSIVSRHLAILVQAGLLRRLDRGRTASFSIDDETFHALADAVVTLAATAD